MQNVYQKKGSLKKKNEKTRKYRGSLKETFHFITIL